MTYRHLAPIPKTDLIGLGRTRASSFVDVPAVNLVSSEVTDSPG